MAKEALPLLATEDQMQELLVMRRSTKIEKRYSQRAEVILLSLEKKTLDEIMLITRMSRPVINKWRQRFRKSGLAGLHDEPRPGKPSVITAEQKAMVIQKACEKPPAGYTSWSQERIGDAVGISQSKVFQILRDADLKPHKIDYWCGKSPDPEFEAKMTGIVGLYMHPPENAIVLCVDEKTRDTSPGPHPAYPAAESAPTEADNIYLKAQRYRSPDRSTRCTYRPNYSADHGVFEQ